MNAVKPLLEWRSFGIGKTIFQQVIHLAICLCGKVLKRGCDLNASFREFGENRLHVEVRGTGPPIERTNPCCLVAAYVVYFALPHVQDIKRPRGRKCDETTVRF